MKILTLASFCVDVFPQSGKILPGGESLNLGVNCKQAGAEVFVMGNIGKDKYGQAIKDAIDKYALNRERIYELDGETANHIIHIDETGDRYFKEGAWTGGVLEKFKISTSDKDFLNTMDAVATTFTAPDFENIVKRQSEKWNVESGINDKSNSSGLPRGFAARNDGQKRPIMAVDFNDFELKPEYEKYFPYIDLFFVSAKSQNSAQVRKTLKEWSEKYNTVFTVTLAEHGSVAYKKGKEFVCQAEKVKEVVDTTGCGDSYQAGFIMEYFKSKDIEKSMQNGSKFAAKTLSFVGGFK